MKAAQPWLLRVGLRPATTCFTFKKQAPTTANSSYKLILS